MKVSQDYVIEVTTKTILPVSSDTQKQILERAEKSE